MMPRVPLAVTTGTLWPAATLESIRLLRENGVSDIELTLQSHEFCFNFKRELQIPIFEHLIEMTGSGVLKVRSLHGVRRPERDCWIGMHPCRSFGHCPT